MTEIFCQYHKQEHKGKNKVAHIACTYHGHCMYPIQCSLFASCPINNKTCK